jgi:hypothetical protein
LLNPDTLLTFLPFQLVTNSLLNYDFHIQIVTYNLTTILRSDDRVRPIGGKFVMPGKLDLTFVDYSGESSNVGIHFPTLDAANFAVQNGLMDDLVAAISGVSIGNLQKDSRKAVETKFAVGNAVNPFAQRELKWLVRMRDANGNPASFEIPAADLSLLSANTDKLDVTTAEGAALVAAINAGARSNDGEVLTFVEAVVVGRSI